MKQMKKILKWLFCLLVVCLCLTSFVNALANNSCTLTVSLTLPDSDLPAKDITVGVSRIAVRSNGVYVMNDSLTSAGITSELLEKDPVDAAEKIFEHTDLNGFPTEKKATDENGEVSFLTENGLFLVYCEKDSAVTFAPYLTEFSAQYEIQPLYTVYSKPKTEYPSSPVVLTSVKVTKLWDDSVNKYGKRPESVTVTLMRDGRPLRKATLGESNGWKHTFSGLNAAYSYTVEEQEIENYTAVYSGNETDGYVIVNKYIGEEIPDIPPVEEYASVTVTKLWQDEDDKHSCRPDSITVQLIANGDIVSTATLNDANSWSYTFTKLDKNLKYTVKEITPSGYSAEYKGNATDGFIITNTYTQATDPGVIPTPEYPDDPIKFDAFVKVIWMDDDNLQGKRPDNVTVYLITDGVIVQSGTVLPVSDWEYTFGNADANKAYTVFEQAVEGYTAVYSGNATDGFVITNIYTESTDPGTPPEPTVPDIPSDTPSEVPDNPDQPKIPQTGHIRTPMYVLMIVGAVIVLTGLFFVMKGGKGVLLVLAGFLLVGFSTAMFISYDREDAVAGKNASVLLREVKAALPPPSLVGEIVTDDSACGELPKKQHLGYSVGGLISIPSINAELPVQSDWSYSLLKTSPCRYSGSAEEGNLILLGHNYKHHFGYLKNCNEGDIVTFTDVNGKVYRYTVAALETLNAYALDELTATDYDLTIFTCTNSGESRYVLRCTLDN